MCNHTKSTSALNEAFSPKSDLKEQAQVSVNDLFDIAFQDQELRTLRNSDPVVVAAVAKYGGEGRSHDEAVGVFLSEARRIMGNHCSADGSPSLGVKLEALKAEVGEDNLKLMLANPHVEAISEAAWHRAEENKFAKAIVEITALLNGAVSMDDIARFLEAA